MDSPIVKTGPIPIEGALNPLGRPKEMLKQVQEVANLLMSVVEKQKLYHDIGGRRHIEVTAWQFAAHFFGIAAQITYCEPYTDHLTGASGFKAKANAIMIASGQVISTGEAICMNDEDNWSTRPKYEWVHGKKEQVGEVPVPSYQLMSMSQTRSIGKVLSNVLRYVAVLAGFSPTPAEEMTGGEEYDQRTPEERQAGKDPQRKSEQGQQQHTNGVISEPQRKRLFAIGKEVGCPNNDLMKIVSSFGFGVVADITKAKYDEVVAAIQNWNTPK